MAQKALKSITFPGLPDVYVVPEGGSGGDISSVNGQTGKVVGDLPSSGATAALWFLKTFGIGLGATLLASLLTNL